MKFSLLSLIVSVSAAELSLSAAEFGVSPKCGAVLDKLFQDKACQAGGGAAGEPDLLVFIPGWRPLYLDIAIVWPSSSGDAARDGEGDKVRKYPIWLERARSRMYDFEPIVFEAYGRRGPKTAAILRKLAERCAMDHGTHPSVELKRWQETLSTRLAVEQARIILNA